MANLQLEVGFFVIREGSGVRLYTYNKHPYKNPDEYDGVPQPINFLDSFTQPWDTGTVTNTNATFYVKPDFSRYSFNLYTDSALTIPATLDEAYHVEELRYSYHNQETTAQTYYLTNLVLDDSKGVGSDIRSAINSEGNSPVRIFYENLVGTIDTSIPGELIYTDPYWSSPSLSTDYLNITIYNDRSQQVIAEFSLDPGSSVDIVLKIINPARNTLFSRT